MTASTPPAPLPYGRPISLAEAARVAAAVQAEAMHHCWTMAIAVVDCGGHLVLFHRMDQTQLGSIMVAQRKAETAIAFRRSTEDFERRLAEGGGHLRMLAMSNVMPVEGGLPLIFDGAIIGAVGVSGMTAMEDAQAARAGHAALAI